MSNSLVLVSENVKSGHEASKISRLLFKVGVKVKTVASQSGYLYKFYCDNEKAFLDARSLDLRVKGAEENFIKKYTK